MLHGRQARRRTLSRTRRRNSIGKVAKRTLLPGRYIPLAAVRDAYLVEQGASVQVYFIAGGTDDLGHRGDARAGSPPATRQGPQHRQRQRLSGTVMADGTVRVGAT